MGDAKPLSKVHQNNHPPYIHKTDLTGKNLNSQHTYLECNTNKTTYFN